MFASNPILFFLTSFELRLVAGLFLFATKMKKRDHFFFRILIFLPLLFTNSIFQWCGISLLNVLMVGWFSFLFPIELALGLACVAFCFDVEWKRILYIGSGAYSYQNACNALAWSLGLRYSLFSGPWYYVIYFVLVIGAWLGLYFGVLKRPWFVTSGRMGVVPLLCVMTGALSILMVYSSYLTFGTRSGTDIHQALFFISALILVVLLFYIHTNIRITEKEILHRLLIEKEKEYRVSQETIAIINQKTHDLKHLVAFVEAHSEGSVFDEAKSIEESIQKYDALVHTGNMTADIVISEKKLYCVNHGINFSCMVDGALLNSWSEVDIYTLLTNALDNAIEATSLIEEEGKRNVVLNVARSGDMVQIRVENSYKVKPVFISDMPITTKTNRKYHGFGVQSIKTTIKKYGGFIDIVVGEEKFLLLLAFPYEEPPLPQDPKTPSTR